MIFRLKTAAGLLLVIIACLVVGMLGYNIATTAEGLTPSGKAHSTREYGAIKRASTRANRIRNNNANTQVRV